MSRNRIEQHSEENRRELNPDYRKGENWDQRTHESRSAFDIKELHECLTSLRDDQLRQIPILVEGTRLEQGAVYFDLRHPERGEVKALGSMSAGPDNWYVPKSDTDYQLWNLLIGIDNWDRLGDLVDEGMDEDRVRQPGSEAALH